MSLVAWDSRAGNCTIEGSWSLMSTPTHTIFIEADSGKGVRRERDKADDVRRAFLNFVCEQCHEFVLFNRCHVGTEGECALEQIRTELERGA
jgi:hypothetical protein